MNRASAITEVVALVDDTFALELTPPNCECAASARGTLLDQILINVLAGGRDFRRWSREAVVDLVRLVVTHAGPADVRTIVAEARDQARWVVDYRAELDVRQRFAARGIDPTDPEVHARVVAMTAPQRRAAVARRVLFERSYLAERTSKRAPKAVAA